MDKVDRLIPAIEKLLRVIREDSYLAEKLLTPIILAAMAMRYVAGEDENNRVYNKFLQMKEFRSFLEQSKTTLYLEAKVESNSDYVKFLQVVEFLLGLGQLKAGLESSTKNFRKRKPKICKAEHSIRYGWFVLEFETFNACLHKLSDEAETMLHLAVRACQCTEDSEAEYKETIDSVVIFILLNTSIINARDRDGRTALMMAAENGCLHIVKVLIDWKDDRDDIKVDLDAEDIFGETALFKAVLRSRVEVVEFLIQRGAQDICDNRGFRALHAAVCGPGDDLETNIVLDFLGDFDWVMYPIIYSLNRNDGNSVIHSCTISRLESITDELENTVKLIDILLRNYPRSIAAEDHRGNSVLGWAIRLKTRVSELTISKLRRFTTFTKQQTNNEDHLDVDDLGRTSFHRLSGIFPSLGFEEAWTPHTLIDILDRASTLDEKHFLPFKTMACRKDNKGRTALHYAAMSKCCRLIKTSIKIGCYVNDIDLHGRTPLHYAKDRAYKLLKEYGANETMKDCDEKTPADLKRLRRNEDDVFKSAFEMLNFHDDDDIDDHDNYEHDDDDHNRYGDDKQYTDDDKNNNDENGTSNYECVRSDSLQSEAVANSLDTSKFTKVDTWNIWTTRKYACRDPLSECLLQNATQFFERLADEIGREDPRFECRSVLVGSAYEGTRIGFMDEFDFNFVLTQFGKYCEISPAPEVPVGFVRLQRKSRLPENISSSKKELDFDSFFNSNGVLMSNKVSSRFRCLYFKVLKQSSFWESERFFEWDMRSEFGTSCTDDGLDPDRCKSQDDVKASKNLGTNIKLRLNRPIKGQYMFKEISVDIVPCITVDGWWPDGTLPTVSDELRAVGCCLVFEQPQRKYPWVPVSPDPYVRISFAAIESRIIKESSDLAKAAYMVVKQMVSIEGGDAFIHVWKNSLLYCIEALNDKRNKNTNFGHVDKNELRSFVEKLTLCFYEFYLLDFCPCYMMPIFSLPIGYEMKCYHRQISDCYNCKWAYKLYFSVCEREPEIPFREPILQPLVEQFDREELMRKLSQTRHPVVNAAQILGSSKPTVDVKRHIQLELPDSKRQKR